jgi:Fe-S cluster assembly protein SufD
VSDTLPTRRDEAWRYSDLAALERAWPLAAPEEIVVPEGGAVARVIVQDAAESAVAVQRYALTIGAEGRAAFHLLNTGGALGRIEIDVTLHRAAHFELGAAMLGGDGQTLEIVTRVQHAEPDGTSNQVIRSVLGGRATGSYLGRIGVSRHAQKTDAAQSVKAMLLARTATANAKPELEIYADDVKCAHGATVGELDRMALFYLQSRGLPPAEAKALLLEAFVAAAFENAEDNARDRLQEAARAALRRLL